MKVNSPHQHRLFVQGGVPLKGQIRVSGSKNAALSILAAALLTDEPVTLQNVPDIADVHTMQGILDFLGVKTEFKNHIFKVHAQTVSDKEIPHELVSRLRASILLLAPLLVRNKRARLAFPGGCVLGKRPVEAHLKAFQALGAEVVENRETLDLRATVGTRHALSLRGADFTMTEASVTATENAVIAAVLAQGVTTIRFAACEPHVQDLCHFLNAMGARIAGIGTHTLEITGVDRLHGADYSVTSDYLEAGTLVLAAAITGGDVEVLNVVSHHLDIFWQKLDEVGVRFTLGKDSVHIFPSNDLRAIRLQTAIFPSFPTDLQAPFATLLTQAKGTSFIFETLFDGRLQYLYELEKMGATFKVLNPYQAEVIGPVRLKGAPVASCDIRAGAATLLASLAAEGETEISNVYYIDRGYERLDEKLIQLGAKIKRLG